MLKKPNGINAAISAPTQNISVKPYEVSEGLTTTA